MRLVVDMTKIIEESIRTEVVNRISIPVVSNELLQEYYSNSMSTNTRPNKTKDILKAPGVS